MVVKRREGARNGGLVVSSVSFLVVLSLMIPTSDAFGYLGLQRR